jgi:hypothetical protein
LEAALTLKREYDWTIREHTHTHTEHDAVNPTSDNLEILIIQPVRRAVQRLEVLFTTVKHNQ